MIKRSQKTNKEIRKWKELNGNEKLKVKSIVHHKFLYENLWRQDRYILVFDVSNIVFTLVFDKISKKSILTQYKTLNKEVTGKYESISSFSLLGECEEI